MAGRARLLCAAAGVGFALAARDLWTHPARWERLPFERGPLRLNAAIDALIALALLLAVAGIPRPAAVLRRRPGRPRRIMGGGGAG